jgi:hypothetical protein
MATSAVVRVGELGKRFVLAAERYTQVSVTSSNLTSTVTTVADVVMLVSTLVTPAQVAGSDDVLVVLDTSDVVDGIVSDHAARVPGRALGSTKRRVQVGDVVVSRLRPYLRQIGVVDEEVAGDCALVGSTELLVLRSTDARSIAFLVPLLLRDDVQAQLQASVEGGHHPRFHKDVLLRVVVDDEVLARREAISRAVLQAVRDRRTSDAGLRAALWARNSA